MYQFVENMNKENKHNDLQKILAQALNDLKNELGEKFDINKVNLAELERRTGITRGKLRSLKANGFAVKPHGLTGKPSNNSGVIKGFTGIINDLLAKGITNASVAYDRISEQGYKGSLSTVKSYIHGNRHLAPAKRQLVAPQGNRGRRYETDPGESYQMDWGFVSAATNLIITGATGAGKTYLSCVLGVEACKQTLRTCYIRMPDMLGHFQNHKDNLREQIRYRKRLGNYKVLIIDEWLNYKINERESKFIYELIEQRCGNSPTIFVGQYDVEDWHERLGGGTQADSIMDRIIHNSYTIPTTDNNLRKLYDSKKAKVVIDSLG